MSRTLVAGPDTFTAADNTTVGTYSASWKDQDDGGGNGAVKVFSNGYTSGSLNMTDACWQGAGTFTDDQYAEATLAGTAFGNVDNRSIGVSLRNDGNFRGTRHMYRVYYNGQALGVKVGKVVNDTETLLGTLITATYNAGDKLSAEIVGAVISVYQDTGSGPVLVGSRTDGGTALTGGKPGICASSDANARGDNWTAGNVVAASFVGARRTGLCDGARNGEIGRASGSVFRKALSGLFVPAWSM